MPVTSRSTSSPVRAWHSRTVVSLYTLLSRHNGPVSALGIVRPSGSRPLIVSSGRKDTTVRLCHARTGEEVLRLVTGTSLTSLCVPPLYDRPTAQHPLIAFGGPAGIAAVTLRLPQSEE